MSKRTHHRIVVVALISMLVAAGSAAAECPAMPELNIPPPPPAPLNIDKVKDLLRDYHGTHYMTDMAAAFAVAQSYVERRAGEVKNPAVVLDIDETSLSNWPNIAADDFGFIGRGRCDDLPDGPCGFDAWVLQAKAQAFPPALKFFNAAKSKGVTIVFITGRRDRQRPATLRNLHRAGFQGWAKLVMRADRDEFQTVEAFKTDARAKLFADGKYTLIANIGDQQSDIEQQPGVDIGKAECRFKLPNPFYFIR
jgi:hypothetical protein